VGVGIPTFGADVKASLVFDFTKSDCFQQINEIIFKLAGVLCFRSQTI
jgi:hypothetical protein